MRPSMASSSCARASAFESRSLTSSSRVWARVVFSSTSWSALPAVASFALCNWIWVSIVLRAARSSREDAMSACSSSDCCRIGLLPELPRFFSASSMTDLSSRRPVVLGVCKPVSISSANV